MTAQGCGEDKARIAAELRLQTAMHERGVRGICCARLVSDPTSVDALNGLATILEGLPVRPS